MGLPLLIGCGFEFERLRGRLFGGRSSVGSCRRPASHSRENIAVDSAAHRLFFVSMGELNKGARRPAGVPASTWRKVGVTVAVDPKARDDAYAKLKVLLRERLGFVHGVGLHTWRMRSGSGASAT